MKRVFLFLMMLVLISLSTLCFALNGEIFLDMATVDKGNSDVANPTAYVLSGALAHEVMGITPFLKAEINFDSSGFDILSREYNLGLEYNFKGIVVRGSYSLEKFRDGLHENLYKAGVGYKF